VKNSWAERKTVNNQSINRKLDEIKIFVRNILYTDNRGRREMIYLKTKYIE
jgi:hypothetical protein